MRPRKTIRIQELTDLVNNMLEKSTCSKDTRQGMIAVIESALHETNSYNGFRYLKGWPCKDETRVEFFSK